MEREFDMQMLTEEQRKALEGHVNHGCIPPNGGRGGLWMLAVETLVWVLTLGRGQVVRKNGRIVHWDGTVK